MTDRKTINIYTILILLFKLSVAQTHFSAGTGINSSIYYLPKFNHYPTPSIPISPYLDIAYKRHEILFGPDIYRLPISKSIILGVQCGYRYHFRKEQRKFNLFIDANFQYSRFLEGCGLPEPYDTPYYVCFDGTTYKTKSFINTYGLGIEYDLLKKLSAYLILGGGMNYWDSKVHIDWSGYNAKSDKYLASILYCRLGVTFRFLQK